MKAIPFVVMLVALVTAPLMLRVVNETLSTTSRNASYLPSYENRRSRKPFNPGPIGDLRYGDPRWVFIGDSMLGTRIDPTMLGRMSGDGSRNVMFLVQAASGPAYWYLAFKNYLVASGVRPDVTFFFFRDTNMTDVMFRLRNQLADALDELAHDREPELDALVASRERGGWSRVDRVLDDLYEVNTATAWMQPAVRRWYALWKYPDPAVRVRFENVIEEEFNRNFRRDLATDLAETEETPDFHRDLPRSVLPLIAALSKEHGLEVCFVRVQRRPSGHTPPPQTPALLKYVEDFRAWAEAHGAMFYDETGDPELPEDLYEDGDHVGDRVTYTRHFRHQLDAVFR